MPEFGISSVDDVLSRAAKTPSGETYEENGVRVHTKTPFSFVLKPKTFLDQEGLNAEARQKLQESAQTLNGHATGIVELRNVFLMSPFGAILDPERGCFWSGSLINWTHRGLRRKLAVRSRSESTFRLPLPRHADEVDEAGLIASPGYAIFGHWLLDFLPKTKRVLDFAEQNVTLYRRPEKSWAIRLGEYVAPDRFSQSYESDQKFLHVRRLLVPTTARSAGLLDEASCLPAWAALKAGITGSHRETRDDRHGAEMIFVSRRNWEKDDNERILVNAEAVEERFSKAGFMIVSPETMSISDQHQLFSKARVIAGEDGSGMHNAIYSAPGTRLGLLAMGRTNTLHAALANCLDQSVTYAPTIAVDETRERTFRADLNVIDRLIAQLLQ